jgi:hypothetical protein
MNEQPSSSFRNVAPIQPKVVSVDYEPLGTPPDNPPANPEAETGNQQQIVPAVMELGATETVSNAVPPSYRLYMSEDSPNNAVGDAGDWYHWIANEDSIIVFQKVDCAWVQKASIPGVDVVACPDGCPVSGDLDGSLPSPSVVAIQGVSVSETDPAAGQVLTAVGSGNAEWQDVPAAEIPDASTSVKGVTKLSVAPATASIPIAVGDNDPRNTNARTPTGPAEGDLSGNYPDPIVSQVHHDEGGTTITIDGGTFNMEGGGSTMSIFNGGGEMDMVNGNNGVAIYASTGSEEFTIINNEDSTYAILRANGNIISALSQSYFFIENRLLQFSSSTDNLFSVDLSDSMQLTLRDMVHGCEFYISPDIDGIVYTNSDSKVFQISPSDLTHNMSIKEIDVCVAGVAKKMLVVASDPYV